MPICKTKQIALAVAVAALAGTYAAEKIEVCEAVKVVYALK